LFSWLREKLTRRRILIDAETGRRVRIVEEPPSRRLLYTIILTLLILVTLTAAQVAWLLVYGEWNSSIFQGLIAVLCITLGALWGRKA
jgi:hypothetical protein